MIDTTIIHLQFLYLIAVNFFSIRQGSNCWRMISLLLLTTITVAMVNSISTLSQSSIKVLSYSRIFPCHDLRGIFPITFRRFCVVNGLGETEGKFDHSKSNLLIEPSTKGISDAANLLRTGHLVAFPTEVSNRLSQQIN